MRTGRQPVIPALTPAPPPPPLGTHTSMMTDDQLISELIRLTDTYEGLSHEQMAKKLHRLYSDFEPHRLPSASVPAPVSPVSASPAPARSHARRSRVKSALLKQQQQPSSLSEQAQSAPVQPVIRLIDPGAMTTSELRDEISSRDSNLLMPLDRRQLEEALRQLRAGRQHVIPRKIDRILAMNRNDIIFELENDYGQDASKLMQLDHNVLVELLNTFSNPNRLGGRKRKSKQRRTNRRRSNRK